MSMQKNITKEAGKSLSGENWGKSIGGCIIYWTVPIILYLVYSIVVAYFGKDIFDIQNYTDGLDTEKILMLCSIGGILLLFLFLSPIMMGYKKLSYQIAKNDASFSDMFWFCSNSSNYFKAIRLNLFKLVYCVFFAVVYYLVPAVITVYSDEIFRYIDKDAKYTNLLWVAVGVLYFLSTLLFVSTMLKQFLVGYVLCEDEDATVSGAISKSSALMRGNRRKLMMLFIRLALWIASCVLVVPIIFVFPYIKTLFAVCGKLIINHNSEDVRVVLP